MLTMTVDKGDEKSAMLSNRKIFARGVEAPHRTGRTPAADSRVFWARQLTQTAYEPDRCAGAPAVYGTAGALAPAMIGVIEALAPLRERQRRLHSAQRPPAALSFQIALAFATQYGRNFTQACLPGHGLSAPADACRSMPIRRELV
ncbi:MAG TPA: hypothetical protein VIK47_00470 [Kiloniellales bacterium]